MQVDRHFHCLLLITLSVLCVFATKSASALDHHLGIDPVMYYDPNTQQSSPFLPIGWYVFGPGPGEEGIEDMQAAGANTVLMAGVPDGLEQIDDVLDRLDTLESLGMKGIIGIRDTLIIDVDSNNPSTYTAMAELVNAVKDHPAVLGYMLGDENYPALDLYDVIHATQALRYLDGNRQIWQVFHNGHSDTTVTNYMGVGTHGLAMDYYNNINNDSDFAGMNNYLETAERFAQLAYANDWPYITVHQGIGPDQGPLSNYEFMTYDEFRLSIFASVASSGARGVLSWVYTDDTAWYSDPGDFDNFRDNVVAPVYQELAGLKHAMETGYNVGTVSLSWSGQGTDGWDYDFDRLGYLLIYDDEQHLYTLIITNNSNEGKVFTATISNLPVTLAGLTVTIPETSQTFSMNDLGGGSYSIVDGTTQHDVIIYQFSASNPEPSTLAIAGAGLFLCGKRLRRRHA